MSGGGFTPLVNPVTQTPLSNLQIEVDKDEGYATLAVVLQYEGVVNLAGITAALKLPTKFKAQYPLTDDRHSFDIALANYDGGIRPSQEVVLYFPLYVLSTAKVQLPVLGPLALHFLRSAPRSVGDSLATTEQNMFVKALSITNGTNQTMFNNSLGLNRNYSDKSGRFIPCDFINQVIPVLFKATGREVLDVYQSCTIHKVPNTKTGKTVCDISAVTPTKGTTTQTGVAIPQNITFSNHGDVPLYNLVVQFNTVLPVLSPSGAVAPQLPMVIQGPSAFYIGTLAPGQNYTIPVYISSAINCNTNQALEADSSYNNIIGVRAEQTQVIGVTTGGNLTCPSWVGSSDKTVGTSKAIERVILLPSK